MPPLDLAPIVAVLPPGFAALAAAARAEGYGFIDRLAAEWADGSNRFDRPGECLLGVRDHVALASIGGLNRDPFLADPGVARLRHLYVHPDWRRHGAGTALVEALLAAARSAGFARIRLRTSNPAAARLYVALGFTATGEPDATHHRAL